MKILKLIAGFLFFIILVTTGLSLFLADSQKVQRSISINASASSIYEQLRKLENFNRIAIWNQQDSSASFQITGVDGTVGATTQWKGHPMISGKGNIKIIELIPTKKIVYQIEFSQPKKGKAESVFDLVETNKSLTSVTWTFELATPRPWNIFNLFYSMDKERGKEFEDGLKMLKTLMETKP